MASKKLSKLAFPIEADSSGIRAELQAVKTQVGADSLSISKALDNVGKAAKRQQGHIKSLSREFVFLGGEATKGLGVAHGAAQSLLGAFASGGALGLGIMVVTQGVALLTDRLAQAGQASRHIEALGRQFGVAKADVDALDAALRQAGAGLDRLETQRLAHLAREAGLSADEVARLAGEARDLATIRGTSIETELTQRIQELGDEAKAAAEWLRRVERQVYELTTGTKISAAQGELAAQMVSHAERVAKIQAEGAKQIEEVRRGLERYDIAGALQRGDEERARALERVEAANRKIAAIEADTDQRVREAQAAVQPYLEGFRRLEAAEQAAKRREDERREAERTAAEARQAAIRAAAEAERQAAEERRRAAAREAAAMQAAVNLAEHRGDKEGAINARLAQRLATLKQLRDKGEISEETFDTESTIATERAERERTAIVTAALRARYDAEAAYRAQLASLTETQVDDLELAQERALEAVQRRIDDEVLAEEEGAQEIARIRNYYGQRIAQQRAKEAAKEDQERKAAASKQEKAEAEAAMKGMAIGASFAQGLRQAIEQEDTQLAAKSIIGLIAGGLTAFGGPAGAAMGFGLQTIAGFFSDGGLVRGRGGPREDRNLIAVSDGEFVQQASAVRRFGVPFMEDLNRGILNLAKLPAFARGGMVGSPPLASAQMPDAWAPAEVTNIFQIKALDPKSTLEVIASRLEPAEVQRGITGDDARQVAYRRQQLAPRKTGRR